MIQVLNAKLSAQSRFQVQNAQYSEKIVLTDSVTAGATKLCRTNVSNLGHFLCTRITGSFETLASVTYSATPKIVDDGVDHLRAVLQDGAGQRIMFSDYVPLSLFLSPGRRRSSLAVNNLLDVANYANAAAASPQLNFPDEFEYLFSANSDILFSVKNDSNTTISFDILFHGIRILSNKSVSGIK